MLIRMFAYRRTPRALALLAVGAVALGAGLLAPTEAEAAVRGRSGIEIEGAQDRRGFYIGGGLGFGGTFFYTNDFVPASRLNFHLGGGVTKRFLLGADLHVTPYLQRRVGVAFGGDIEATGILWRGLYVRGGLGLTGVPQRDVAAMVNRRAPSVGLGGKVGAGYEFFLNSSAAMGVGVTYDARFVSGDTFPRQTALIGLRFTWY